MTITKAAAIEDFASECDARYETKYTVDDLTGKQRSVQFSTMTEALELLKEWGMEGKARVCAWGMCLGTVREGELIFMSNHIYIQEFRTYWGG